MRQSCQDGAPHPAGFQSRGVTPPHHCDKPALPTQIRSLTLGEWELWACPHPPRLPPCFHGPGPAWPAVTRTPGDLGQGCARPGPKGSGDHSQDSWWAPGRQHYGQEQVKIIAGGPWVSGGRQMDWAPQATPVWLPWLGRGWQLGCSWAFLLAHPQEEVGSTPQKWGSEGRGSGRALQSWWWGL